MGEPSSKEFKISRILGILIGAVILYIGINYVIDERVSTGQNLVVDIETESYETKDYTYFISFPTFENQEVNTPIENWVEQQKESFFKMVKEYKEETSESLEDFRPHLNIKVNIEQVNAELYTLILEAHQYTGGANGMNFVKGFTVNVAENKMLDLFDVLKSNETSQKHLLNVIKDSIAHDQNLKDFVIEELLEEAIQNWKKLKWSINLKHLTLHFDKYEIGAGALGTVNLPLPLEQLHPILEDEIKRALPAPRAFDMALEEEAVDEQDSSSEDHKGEKKDSAVKDEKKDEKEASKKEKKKDKTKKKKKEKSKKRYVALTFDDGPDPAVTPQVLETLKAYDVKATFFMLGSQVDYYPKTAKLVAEEGHEIANHTFNHVDLTVLKQKKVLDELERSRKVIKDVTGHDPHFVRPPYGAYDDSLKKQLKKRKESMILWSVDSLDWKSKDASEINKMILNTVTSGAVILMHDIHQETAEALPTLIEQLHKEGYEIVTVSELMNMQDQEGIEVFYGEYK